LEAKLAEREAHYAKQGMFAKVRDKAIAELRNLRPILPEDAHKAQRWEDKFIDEFKPFDYQEQDDTFVIMKDGKPLQDSHGYTKSFADHVKETASDFFDFRAAEDRSSSGLKQTNDKQTAKVPKNDDEYTQKMRDAKTPEERIEIMESYTKTKK